MGRLVSRSKVPFLWGGESGPNLTQDSLGPPHSILTTSTADVMTSWRCTNLFIVIIIIIDWFRRFCTAYPCAQHRDGRTTFVKL